jgi:hypothetical protein
MITLSGKTTNIAQLIVSAVIVLMPIAAQSGVVESLGYSVITDSSSDDVPLLAIGAISSVDDSLGHVIVNGQTIIFDSQTIVEGSDATTAGLAGIRQLTVGDHVAIAGEIVDPGTSLATLVLQLEESYVAGDSPAYLRAIIDEISPSTAIAESGSSIIDLSSASPEELSLGTEAEFFGFAYDNTFVASASASVQRIRGSGVRRIRGSGVRRIRGSGVRELEDAAVQRIRGSGVRRIRGSGVRRIRGSGVRSNSNTSSS